MNLLAKAISTFTRTHGQPPAEVIVTPHASVALALLVDQMANSYDGVKIRIGDIDTDTARPPGTGTRIGLFVRETAVGHVVAAVELT